MGDRVEDHAGVIAAAALTGPVPRLGVLALAALVGGALLAGSVRGRALAMLGALGLAPVLLLADIWHSPQLGSVHRHPLAAALAAVVALAVLAAVAREMSRRPWLVGVLVVLALPFRVPIEAGGTTSNLLVPLYFVVGAGSLAVAVPALRTGDRAPARAGWIERLLAAYVGVYALQSVYSADFEKALQQMVFFYAPFALMLCLLRELAWDRMLVRRCLGLLAGMAVVFALLGFVEYATKTVVLNPKLVVQNDLHAYFTVNSVFFDPDIFGRFLALVMIMLAAVLLSSRRRNEQLPVVAALAVLWGGLVLTLSRSSLAALLVGLGVLATLRWRPARTLYVAAVVIVAGALAVAASPNTFGLNQGLNGASSGRAGLVSGGVRMFGQRPPWGYGSGAFVTEYRRQHPATSTTLAASHTIPITVAAEQGLIGLVVYAALVLVAVATLLRGARGDPVRGAIAAAFLALVFHTMLYADFLEDPTAWALLAIGVALANRPPPARRRQAAASRRQKAVAAA
ncbi:MAG: O-antigen ligase family protein [Solirubrobacterales bacterium]|nr:O-antigen ligase family protein [Solirubrobacterales bacterium]MBV9716463.1 O-antigen ligase family protein [Solirubrobacterales bacterium]